MNIIQVFQQFPTQEDCIEHLESIRWPDRPVCPYCDSDNNGKSKKELRHYCNNCKTSFSVTVGTIFHRTHLPLQKWFLAIALILNAKKGISALQLSRDIKVNKNTAWRISMQTRKAMSQTIQRELLTGVVEMDETYIGGKPRKSKKYDDGDIHTNTIEGFWALLKRGMFGQFHSFSRKYLQRYVDEFYYHYNNRENGNTFDLTISRALGV